MEKGQNSDNCKRSKPLPSFMEKMNHKILANSSSACSSPPGPCHEKAKNHHQIHN